MTEVFQSKGQQLAGVRHTTEPEPMEVGQVRLTVAGLIDALDAYHEQYTSAESKRCLVEAQRYFELGCMMAVKGLYAATQEK